jgi:solute carrier family 25 S-adenosylmethionine transporter 26
MGLGAISGACAAAVTTPLDVAKTRLMTQTLVASELRYTGVLHALTKVYEEGGVRALFAGIKPRVAWISVGGAIFIGSFEEYRRRISNVQ